MQARVVKASVKNAEGAPEALLQQVVAMAHSFHAQTPEAVQTAIDAANAALSSILPTLTAEHTHAQAQVQLQFDEIGACLRNMESGHADVLTSQRTQKNQCLQSQTETAQRVLDECENGWFAHVDGLSHRLPSCAADTPEAFYSTVNSWRSFVQDEWAVISSEKSECEEASRDQAALQISCPLLSSTFDGTFCRHRLMCRLATACRAHEMEVFNTMKPGIEEDMASRQRQFHTVAQVGCILDLIHDAMGTNNTIADTSLAACGDDADISSLTVLFPELPDAAPDVCADPEAGDPECPDDEVEVATTWENGEAVATVPAGPAEMCGRLAAGGECFATVDLANGARAWNDRTYHMYNVAQELEGATVFQNPVRTYPPGMIFSTDRPTMLIIWSETSRNGGFQNMGWEAQNPCPRASGIGVTWCFKKLVEAGETEIPIAAVSPVVGGFFAMPV